MLDKILKIGNWIITLSVAYYIIHYLIWLRRYLENVRQ